MREIPLTQGKVTIVDDEDFGRLVAMGCWQAHKRGHVWYATIDIYPTGKKRKVRMHRIIMNAPDGTEIDHKNVDGLDNRRTNLRFSTRSQNMANTPNFTRKSGYRGVYRQSSSVTFMAKITAHNKRIYLGTFGRPEDAARAYDAAAAHYFGEFARLNFPMENQ